MRIDGDVAGDLGQMQVHGRGVDLRQRERRRSSRPRDRRREEIGGLVALIPGAVAVA